MLVQPSLGYLHVGQNVVACGRNRAGLRTVQFLSHAIFCSTFRHFLKKFALIVLLRPSFC